MTCYKKISSTGYVLQQCAYNNCLDHFSKIVENKDLTVDDLMYGDQGGEENTMRDNPLMIAAKQRHKDIVTSVLRSPKFQQSDNNNFLSELLHQKNEHNQTLLAMVALQG